MRATIEKQTAQGRVRIMHIERLEEGRYSVLMERDGEPFVEQITVGGR